MADSLNEQELEHPNMLDDAGGLESLTQSLQLLLSGLELMQFGFAVFDKDLRLIASNKRFAEVQGLDRSFCCPGVKLEALFRFRAEKGDFDENDIDNVIAERVEKIAKFEQHEVEYKFSDGSYLVFRYEPIPSGGVLCTLNDISEIRHAEKRIRQLARMPEENPNPVLRFTRDGTMEYANQASEILRASINCQLGEKGPEDLQKLFVYVLDSDTHAEFEYEHAGRTYAIMLAPVSDEDIVNVYCRDISQQKIAETEIIEARAKAEEASSAKSTFLANMSHELRTPLNAVIGYSELLQDEAKDLPEIRDTFVPDLEKIHGAGRHLLDLINGVLDISKIESGKMEVYSESFDIFKMIDEIPATVLPLVQKNNNSLEIHCEQNIGSMHSDLLKIRQTLFNLLSNAAKFTEQGHITLSVEKGVYNQQQIVLFTVSDTGIGMTADQISKVFDPFSQADASTTRKYGGTGLGLSITQQFCRLLGGDIDVVSEHGKGTSFIIRLPVDYQPDLSLRDQQTSRSEAEQSRSDEIDLNAHKVMVVDDDPVARDLLRRHLEKDGYNVRTVADGNEAYAIAQTWQPDVITLDVLMANVDGWTVLSKLKHDDGVSDIPVIMVSIIDEKKMGYTLGAADYISKPVQQNLLLDVVAKHIPDDTEQFKLLVIDDDEATRSVVKRAFEKLNCDVSQAVNGQAGWEQLDQVIPDIILLDLMMPEVDGFEFLDKVKNTAEWKDIPVIVLTAKTLTKRDYARLQGRVEKIYEKSEAPLIQILSKVSQQIRSQLLSDKSP